MAGIHCTIVSGMNKSAAYEIGKEADRKTMGAQWNAVYVNDDWRFIDAFWASACVIDNKSGEWTLVDADGAVTQEDEEESDGTSQHRINEFYFLPDPDKLIWTHFPDEEKWQLLNIAESKKGFKSHVYIRERFYYLGMEMTPRSQIKCVLNAKGGEIGLEFALTPERSENFRYKYMLYTSKGGQKDDRGVDLLLDRFVLFEHTADILRFALRFPIAGKFKMDVFGLDTTDSDMFDLACTYVIICNEPMKNCLPLPDCPPIGWGPGGEAKKVGLKPITHETAIIDTEDGNVEIRLKAANVGLELSNMLKHALIDEAALSNYAITYMEDGEAVVSIRLPQDGEYALKLYANESGEEGAAPNVLNYLIRCKNKKLANSPFPNVTDGTLGENPIADKLGVKAVSHKGAKIQAQGGKAKVKFTADKKMELMCELHSSNGEAMRTMKVETREENGKWVFDMDMPVEGQYSLNIFARDKSAKSRVYNVHSYLVTSDGRALTEEEALAAMDDGSDPNLRTETVFTSESEIMIPVPFGHGKIVEALRRRNVNDPPDPKQVEMINSDGMEMINAKLNEYGEYMLNMYEVDDKGTCKAIVRYLIHRKVASELYEDNTKMLMQNLGAQEDKQDEPEPEEEVIKGETEEGGFCLVLLKFICVPLLLFRLLNEFSLVLD